MIGANIILKLIETMNNQVIFGGQINMQNNMRTIHVGIFHLSQKTKNKKTCWV